MLGDNNDKKSSPGYSIVETVTIKQVAEAAGVSVMTVSRVLNNRPDVSSATRKRIQKIIEELGYAPNVMASSLRQGRSNTVGVVATGIEYFGPSHTLVGIEQQAERLGYSLLLNLLHEPEAGDGNDVLESMLARQVDGIIWAVPEIGNNRKRICARVHDISKPVVFLSMRPHAGLMSAAVDNLTGGRLATEHLLSLGKRQIGIITGPMSWWEAQQRADGWRNALQEAGISNLDALWAEGDWSAASGEAGLCRLLEQCPNIDALFASNDQMALGALQAARRTGRQIPQDLAIVGFDDIPESAYFCPPLTTVRQDMRLVGQQAIRLLDRVLEARRNEHEIEPEAVWVAPELVIRESSVQP
jgi:LacI family transcriptional regulator